MPFGLVNAHATFQTMMNEILREFLDQGVVVYIDDILIYSQTLEEHIIPVRKVLSSAKTDPASDPSALRPDASDASPASHASCAS